MKVVIEVEENFSTDWVTETGYSVEPIPLDDFIASHNEKAKKPHPATNLPVRWEDETEERKETLLKYAFYRWPYSIVPRKAVHRPNGYFYTYKVDDKVKWWRKLQKQPEELFHTTPYP